MAKIREMIGEKVIDGFKGVIDFYYYMGIPCARKWPRSPGKRRTPAVEARWAAFTYAAREWNNLSSTVQESYKRLAKGTGLSGRDVQQRAYLIGLYRYPTP